jgi:hypothetical protein
MKFITNFTAKTISVRRPAGAAALAAAFLAVSGGNLPAGTFTQGDLVVERLGDGSQVLANTGNTIFFDEITTNGALVQSIQIPSTGATPLVDAGGSSASTEGGVTLSADGKSLVFPGYEVSLPFATSVTTNFGTVVPRGIGRLDLNGNYTLAATSFGATNSAFSGSTFRGAASDGTNNFWGSGTYYGSPDDDGGVWYFGSNSPQAQVYYNSTHTANLRCLGIFNGNLWFDTASSTALGYGFWYFNGLPTASSTPTRAFTTTSSDSEYSFSVSPDGTVIYYADDGAESVANAGIHKLVLSGGVWSSNIITVPTSSAGTNTFYGLTVDWTQLPVKLYTTTGSGTASNSLVSLFDTGSNSTFTVIATTGATNKMYRGVVFAPATSQAGATPAPPTLTGLNPSSLVTNAGSRLSFVPSGTPGSPIASNYWFEITGSTTNLLAAGSAASGAALAFPNLQPSNAGTYFLVLSNASGAVTSSVVTLTVSDTPYVVSISPSSTFTNLVGSSQTFTAQTDSGYPAASNYWYFVNGTTSTTNLITWATNFLTSVTVTNLQLTNAGGYFLVVSNVYGSATSSVVNMGIFVPVPVIYGLSPSNSITVGAGAAIPFLLNAYQGSPLASNFWYQIAGSTTSLVSTVFGYTITNAATANSGSYFAVLTNVYGLATSPVVSITITGDPSIVIEPSSAQGLVKSTVQFGVVAGGTQPFHYQWYFSDTNGNLIAPVASLGDGSLLSGANGSVLTFANLQPNDVTNFMVVITNIYGAVTSTVASILTGTNTSGAGGVGVPDHDAVLALWDFDGPQFTGNPAYFPYVNYPAPFIGYGTATAVGTTYNPQGNPAGNPSNNQSPFPGATDPNDVGYDSSVGGYVFTPYGFEQPSPNGSWGTDNYPITGTNKANGVQFNVSTLGARNIRLSYDSRVSATASDYERLQYTTNGTTWIDYPASSTFAGNYGSGDAGFYTFQYSLVGFPGVDNNTNFGVRIVTEWQSTATYQTAATMANTNNLGVNGVYPTNYWVGTANSYASGQVLASNAAAGTVTYDLVAFIADAITNNNTPPTIALANIPATNGLSFTNMVDTNTLVVNFTAGSAQMPSSDLTFAVQPISTVSAGNYVQTVNPHFAVANTGGSNYQLSISFTSPFIPDPQDAAPILITATDTNGESAAAWFLLAVQSINLPPTNTLTAVHATNVLANSSLVIPFTVGSAKDPTSGFTYSITSDNNAVLPVSNAVIGGNTTTGNLTLTLTPAAGQVGNALVTVTVNDNDPVEPRSTTASIDVIVRPNTNVVAVDYFNYTGSGALDTVAAGYWNHLSGVLGQLQAGNGVATIAVGDTENVQAALLGNPYASSSGDVLYSSFTVNMSAGQMPTVNGSYFLAFNDGSGVTADVEDCVVAATNNAAPGYYRLGVGNVVGATAATAQMFPLDLAPGQTYFVITALSLNDGQSTLWVSPTNQASPSVTDTAATTLYNIVDVELRESGVNQGTISLGNLLVGKTFDSVFYPPVANPAAYGVTENTVGDLLNPLSNDGGSGLSLASVSETDGNGTASISGTSVAFTPAHNFTGTASITYTLVDDMGSNSTSTISVTVTNDPPLANPVSYVVAKNSVNNVLNPLAHDAVQTPGGALGLLSVSATNGTASISGTNVLFTPAAGFTGTATIGYAITDNLGGTNSSLITVAVGLTSIPLSLQVSGANHVLSWNNAPFGFSLQFATSVEGPYVTIPGAGSPYTIPPTNAAGFYRLVYQY